MNGSSPHTRGALYRALAILEGSRIIPAYAGSTGVRRSSSTPISDHPRIRGEHFEPSPRGDLTSGSSPHTRGARSPPFAPGRNPGIIPAYAGSTPASRPLAARVADHPRIRGEHRLGDARRRRVEGSSPHTRGAPRRQAVRVEKGGIIPAYAGSTRARRGPRTGRADHPRIRGEHLSQPPAEVTSIGSSPHTRGARVKLSYL